MTFAPARQRGPRSCPSYLRRSSGGVIDKDAPAAVPLLAHYESRRTLEQGLAVDLTVAKS
jgi:hypothetical protein